MTCRSTPGSRWKAVAADLGLEVINDFEVVLPSGHSFCAPVFVPHFGAERGMLVLGDYGLVKAHTEEIAWAGYGFSILDEPSEHEKYVRADYVDMLKDWGWSGAESERPRWLDEESK